MERAVEVFFVIQFLIVGLSHVLQPRVWVDFFLWLRARGHAGVFAYGFLYLWVGAAIVAFHNVWTGLPLILTVVGYLHLVKAGVCFLLPETQMKSLDRVSRERAWEFRYAGILLIALGAVLAYSLWLA